MRHDTDIAVFSQMPKPLEPAGDSFYRPTDRRGSARVIFIDTGRKNEGTWAVSSAVEHYVDIVVATGSIPVPPTISPFSCEGKHQGFQGAARREWEKNDEGCELAPLAQDASSRLPGRAPQGPRLCDQQDAEAVQGPSGLIFPNVSDEKVAHWAAFFFFVPSHWERCLNSGS
jgi:hypothetical protein